MVTLATDDSSTLASPLVAASGEVHCETPAKAEGSTNVAQGLPSGETQESGEMRESPEAQESLQVLSARHEPLALEDVVLALQPLREFYAYWFSELRSWDEFAKFSFPGSVTEVCGRVPSNLLAYRANYGTLALVVFGAANLMFPPGLLANLLLCFIWCVLTKHKDDPDWKVKCGPCEIRMYEQKAAFNAALVLAALLFWVPMIFWAGPSSLTITFIHSVLHPAIETNKLESGLETRQAREVAIDPEAPAAVDSAE